MRLLSYTDVPSTICLTILYRKSVISREHTRSGWPRSDARSLVDLWMNVAWHSDYLALFLLSVRLRLFVDCTDRVRGVHEIGGTVDWSSYKLEISQCLNNKLHTIPDTPTVRLARNNERNNNF